MVKVLKAAIAHVRVVKFGKDEYENHRKTFRCVSGFQLTDLKFITCVRKASEKLNGIV